MLLHVDARDIIFLHCKLSLFLALLPLRRACGLQPKGTVAAAYRTGQGMPYHSALKVQSIMSSGQMNSDMKLHNSGSYAACANGDPGVATLMGL